MDQYRIALNVSRKSNNSPSFAVRAGKVRYIGLSNVTAEEVRRAQRASDIRGAIRIFAAAPRSGNRSAARSCGISASGGGSSLGNGFLPVRSNTLGQNGLRRHRPKFSDANFATNRDRFAPFLKVANELDVTPAQLALP
ncbi:MAG TPA: aldo/keto reductase [Burkholderiales bacterium]|nr:aldo/keto reductase [Burkholderiales bacterium]